MFLDFHRTSTGRFVIMAEVVGSMGERCEVQVGRFHKTPRAAVEAAYNLAEKNRYRYCYVTDRRGWMYTVRA